MYKSTIIEPARDEGTPVLPSLIIGGVGFVDADRQPVEVFRRATEDDVWRAAFDASVWDDLAAFRENTELNGHYPQAWSAVCPGRLEPARWFYLVIPREELTAQIEKAISL